MSVRASLAALTALVLTSGWADAGAVPLTDQAWRTLKVGVLEVRSYVRGPQDLFIERPEVRRVRELAGEWQRTLEHAFGGRDQVSLVPIDRVRSRLERSSALRLGRRVFSFGVDRYRALKNKDALKYLDEAAEIFDEGFIDLARPRDAADVELYRGLACMESGLAGRAHIAFRRMLLLDPSRSFKQGYYSEATEKAIRSALVDLAAMPDKSRAGLPLERLKKLAGEVGVDVWVIAAIDGTLDAPQLHLAVYDGESNGLVVNERIDLSADPAAARERVDRAASTWHACAVQTKKVRLGPPPFRGGVWLDIGYSHALPLAHGTREMFQLSGVLLGVTWDATEYLHVFGRAVQASTIADSDRDLMGRIDSTRVAAGVGLAGGTHEFQAYLEAGLELAISASDIRITSDVDCKHFGAAHERCDLRFHAEAPAFLFGLTIASGFRWRFWRGFYLHFAVGISTYVVETELANEFNFPLTFSLGLGNRF